MLHSFIKKKFDWLDSHSSLVRCFQCFTHFELHDLFDALFVHRYLVDYGNHDANW